VKDGFKTIQEILEEVAEDEGMSKREIQDLWEHQKKYIKKQMEEENVYAISLPYIGNLSLNLKQASKEIRGLNKVVYKEFIEKTNNLVSHKDFKIFGNAHKRVTGVNRLARRIIKNFHTEIDKPRRLIMHKKCWDIIAKYSNDMYKKREKK